MSQLTMLHLGLLKLIKSRQETVNFIVCISNHSITSIIYSF